MPASEPFSALTGISFHTLSKKENFLLEVELFIQVYDVLKDFFRPLYKDYFYLMKFTREKENEMLELDLLPNVINDILKTEDYSLQGIAYYTQTCDDVISDIVSGRNTSPSFPLIRRIIDLHRTVRPELYREIIKKILNNLQPNQKENNLRDKNG